MSKNQQQIYHLKTMQSGITWKISRLPHAPPLWTSLMYGPMSLIQYDNLTDFSLVVSFLYPLSGL